MRSLPEADELRSAARGLRVPKLKRADLQMLCDRFALGAEVVEAPGDNSVLVKTRNKGAERGCYVTPGTTHESNHGYLCVRRDGLHFGCHGCRDAGEKLVFTWDDVVSTGAVLHERGAVQGAPVTASDRAMVGLADTLDAWQRVSTANETLTEVREEQLSRCTGGVRDRASWGRFIHLEELYEWAKRLYRRVTSVADWNRFCNTVSREVDRHFVFVRGVRQEWVFREIMTDKWGHLKECWFTWGSENQLFRACSSWRFKPWALVGKKNPEEKPSGRAVNLGEMWWHWEYKCMRERCVLNPMGVDDARFQPSKEFNVWRGHWITKEESLVMGDVTNEHLLKLLAVVKDTLCKGDEEANQYLLNWLAFIVQKPGVKTVSMPILRGLPGTGKGVVIGFLKKIVGGRYFVPLKSAAELTNHFNAHLDGKLLVFVDEADFSQQPGEMGIVRAYISEEDITITKKGVDDASEARSWFSVIAATNVGEALPAEEGERRALLLDSGDRQGMRAMPVEEREAIANVLPHHL